MPIDQEQRQQASGAVPFTLPIDFLARYWRSRPLLLPGAASAFLTESPTRDEITALLSDGAPHQTDGATVWFLEGMTSGLTGIEELVTRARNWLEWQDVWCDVFTTAGRSSIGSHYDGSDNFTIQLAGNKTWYLSSPDGIHPDDRRRRILCEPGVGVASMPPAPLVFEVRAGDVLYIPSTWIHWGLSDGDSTSVSLVVNVATPFHALQEQLLHGLRCDSVWSLPLPVGPGSSAVRAGALRQLIGQDLSETLKSGLLARVGDREGSATTLKGQFTGGNRAAVSPEQPWLRDYVGQVDARPDDVGLGERRLGELAMVKARRNGERLLAQCHERSLQTSSDDVRNVYSAVATGLQEMPHVALDSALTDPDICSWLTLAERDTAMASGRPRAEDPLAHALGLALLPELTPLLLEHPPVTITVGPDDDGTLALRRIGLRIRFADSPARVTLSARGGELYRLGPGDRRHRISRTLSTHGPDGLSVDALPVSSTGLTFTTARSDWLDRVAPGIPLGSPADPGLDWADRAESVAGPFVSWVLLRKGVAPTLGGEWPVPQVPGLVVADAGDPGRLGAVLACAHAQAEFDVVSSCFPLVKEEDLAAAQRKALSRELRRAYVRGRAGASDISDFPKDQLTPWGLSLLGWATSAA